MPKIDDRSWLDVLGKETGCRRLAAEFYARVATCEELRSLFPGKSLRCATEEFAAFLIQFLEGDEDQTQYRWWLSLRESHARFEISERQRSAWLRLMHEAVNSVVNDAGARQELDRFFAATSGYVVGHGEAEIDAGELGARWSDQRALDQIIEDIANARDAEAVAGSRRFDGRPSVFVGILARMMTAEREPLVDFVLDRLPAQPGLTQSRFNGRTLLHHAAGQACLPVVRQLLELGVDPNVLDRGGYTPLYRAAGSRSEQGALTVRELVRSGATVDFAGAVSRSSPLHEAARHGNTSVVEALLAAGADPRAKDRKGLTPHDRATNCRRYSVAALLAPKA